MKKAFTVLASTMFLASCLSSPTYVSATNSNNEAPYTLSADEIAALINLGVDSQLLKTAMSINNTRSIKKEYVIAFYTTQSFVENHPIAHLETATYFSSNLTPYLFYDSAHFCNTSYVNNEGIFEINNESISITGTNFTSNYSSDMLYLGSSGDWITAGLFTKTGTGNITLGQNPNSGVGPITSLYLTGSGANINCANPSYETTLLGDVNNDGTVDVTDVVCVYQISSSSTKKEKLAADVNLDHSYDATDANMILNLIAKNIDSFFDNAVLTYTAD